MLSKSVVEIRDLEKRSFLRSKVIKFTLFGDTQEDFSKDYVVLSRDIEVVESKIQFEWPK